MRTREPVPARRMRLLLLPWLVYVGVTVVVPASNGAHPREPGFAEHAIITLGVSGAILMLWLAADRARLGARKPAATPSGGRRPDSLRVGVTGRR